MSIQSADDAHAFRRLLPDNRGRYIAATLVDIVFALAYGLGALSMSVLTRLSVAGGLCVLLGAFADEFENVGLLGNIRREATVDDRAIGLMRIYGRIKWGFLIGGVMVLIIAYILHRRERRQA